MIVKPSLFVGEAILLLLWRFGEAFLIKQHSRDLTPFDSFSPSSSLRLFLLLQKMIRFCCSKTIDGIYSFSSAIK